MESSEVQGDETENEKTRPMTEARGTVIEVRPKLLYRIRLEGGAVVTAGLGPTLKHGIARLVVGDGVLVSISERDPHRGHIVDKAQ